VDEKLCGQDFFGLVSLNKLEISFCRGLQAIEQDFFKCMPNLLSIILAYCPIESIQPGAFIRVPKLKRLHIRHSERLKECVSLSELTNLETLDLSFNKITSVNMLTAALSRHTVNTTLKVLILEGNQLQVLYSCAFSGLSALKILDLTCNHIKTIERGAFCGLANLQELLLNGNTLIEPFYLSLVFDPELVNLRAVDFAGLKTRHGYIWESKPFQDVTFNLDFQKLFASFRHTVLIFLDCSRLKSGDKVIKELKKVGFIHLPDIPVNNQ
jgi:Leucine-rich repeat (LRR) protein